MSFATIMVQVDVRGALSGRVRLASQLAERFQSRLIGISSWMPKPPFAVEGVNIDPKLTAEDLANMRAALADRGNAFKASVGIDADRVEWRCSQEFPSEYIAREARAADLIVISRERDGLDPYVVPDPGELILRAGRPVLAVPPGIDAINGRRVIVAWKDTREARRALRDALPILHGVEEVVVTEVCEHADDVTASQNRLRDVARYLASHRIGPVTEHVRPLEGTVVNGLLQLAQDKSADLIVAGAYGHSRLGEWIFGGATQDLLAGSPICCLFSH